MEKLYEERKKKISRIVEEYDKRNTQNDIAKMFSMNPRHVASVTQQKNYKHTRKVTIDNMRDGERINAINVLSDFEFLDQYPMENFEE